MARLVVLALFLIVAGCSVQTTLPTSPDTIIELPNAIERLDEGEHHPAIARLLQQAEQARLYGRLATAASYIDQAREIQPRNPEVFYRQAWLALQQGKVMDAESFARRGLVFASKGSVVEVRLQMLLADSLDQQGRLMEAQVIRAQIEAQ